MRCLMACITRNPATALTFSKLYSQPDRARWPCTPSEMLTSGVHMSLLPSWITVDDYCPRDSLDLIPSHSGQNFFPTIPFSSVFFFCVSFPSIYFRIFLCRGGWGSTVQKRNKCLASFNMDWSFHVLVLILSQPACKLEQLLLLLH
ncbi:hypothetical protein BDW67DRAFT_54865 [Aspergillus spinulosporus]